MDRNAEMSIALIVGIVIALVILFLIIFLVSRGGNGLIDASSCPAQGGSCSVDSCMGTELFSSDGKQLCPDNKHCCKIVG